MEDTRKKLRPATAGASKDRNRGSLNSFLDPSMTAKVYGEKKKIDSKETTRKGSDLSKSLSSSKKLYRPKSATATLDIKEETIKLECARQFDDHWYLEDCDRFKTSANHIVRENVFQVNNTLLSKEFLRPKSAAYISTFRTVTDTPSKYQLPSIRPVMVGMSKSELVEQSDLIFNLDSIRLGEEKSKYLNLKLGAKTMRAYQQRKEERISEAAKTIESSQLDNELWLKRDRQAVEVNANDALFLECLRKDVLPYPLASVDKMMRKFVHFDQSSVIGYSTIKEEESSLQEQELNYQNVNNNANRAPSGSVVIPGTSITEVRSSNILELNLTERSIGNERAICLADACQFCPGLQVLKIPNNRLNDYSSAKLIYSLLKYTQVTYIDISENSLSSSSIELLGRYLSNPKSTIRHLNIGNCEISDELLGSFGKLLMTNINLEFLSVSNNKLGQVNDENVIAYANLLRQHPSLKSFHASSNFIRKNAACELLRSLRDNQSLIDLDLSCNQINDACLLPAIDCMESNVQLQELNLSYNQIESRGCIALAYISSRPQSGMKRLNLLGNSIGDMGFSFAMLMVREVAIRNASSISSTDHHSTICDPLSPSERCKVENNMKGVDLESDEEYDETTSSPKESHSTNNISSCHLLHILCEAKIIGEDVGFLQLWSAIGRYQINLSDPFERTVARYFLDRVNQHPFGSIVECKYYNPTTRMSEYLLLKRESDVAVADDSRRENLEKSFEERLLASLKAIFGIHHGLENLLPIFKQYEDTLRQWRDDPTQHGKLCTFLLQHFLTALLGSDSKDVSTSTILALAKTFASSKDKIALPVQNGSLAGCDITAQESINRWLSEGNIFHQTNELDRLKVIHILMHQVISSHWITPKTTPYLIYSAGGKYENWVPPTTGNLQLQIRLPDSFGIKAFAFPDHSFQVFLRSLVSLPKEFYNVASYFQQLLDVSYRQKVNILQVTCEQAEWILKHLLKSKTMNHVEAIEKLIFHIVSPHETRRFLTRNLYFHEIVYMRKKLGCAFRVLTGNVTGHYYLDLTNPLHRFTATKLAAYSNFECQQYPELLKCKLAQNARLPTHKQAASSTSTTGKNRPATAGNSRSNNKLDMKQTSPLDQELSYPKDPGAFHFRNPSYNGVFAPIDAEWLHTTVLPEMGKVRFDFVAYDTTAHLMTPSMEFTSGSRAPIVLPATAATEEAQRVRKEAFVDILMNNVFSSSALLRYSAKLMEKKKLQPKNFAHASAAKSPQDRAGLFDLSRTTEDVLQQLHQELQQHHPSTTTTAGDSIPEDNDEEVDGDDDEDEDEDDEGTHLEDESRCEDKQQGLDPRQRLNGHAKAVPIVGGRLGRSTFLKLQDQSEDIDTGVRQAFVRVNTPLEKATKGIAYPEKDEEKTQPEDQDSSQGEHNDQGLALKNRGMIVTNVTHTSNNTFAQEHLVLEKRHVTDTSNLKSKSKQKKPKNKRPMFRKNRTVYEKMHLAESTDWWRDLFETSHAVYVNAHKRNLMKIGATVYKQTLTSRELKNMDLSKLERENYPEEVYLSPEYESMARMPLFRHIDLTSTNNNNNNISNIIPANPFTSMSHQTTTSFSSKPESCVLGPKAPSSSLSLSIPDHVTSRGISMGLSCEDALLALEVFLLYNVWLDSYQVGLILKVFQQRLSAQWEKDASVMSHAQAPWRLQPSPLLQTSHRFHKDKDETTSIISTPLSPTHHHFHNSSSPLPTGVSFTDFFQSIVFQHVVSLLWHRVTDKATNQLTMVLHRHFKVASSSSSLGQQSTETLPAAVSLGQLLWTEQRHRIGLAALWTPFHLTASSPLLCDLAQADQRYICQQVLKLLKEDPALAMGAEWWYQPSLLQAFVPQRPFFLSTTTAHAHHTLSSTEKKDDNEDQSLPIQPPTSSKKKVPKSISASPSHNTAIEGTNDAGLHNLWNAVAKWPEKDLYPSFGWVKIVLRDTTQDTTGTAAPNWTLRRSMWQRTALAVCHAPLVSSLASSLLTTSEEVND